MKVRVMMQVDIHLDAPPVPGTPAFEGACMESYLKRLAEIKKITEEGGVASGFCFSAGIILQGTT